jgi:hypothetical protein
MYTTDEAIVPIEDLPVGCFLINAISSTGILGNAILIKVN